MRALAFLLTATGFATLFLGLVVASVTLTANTKERVAPARSVLSN